MYFTKTHHFDVGLEKGISSERLVGKKSLTLALYRRLKQKTDAWQRWPAKTFSKSFAWFSGVVGPGTSVRSLALRARTIALRALCRGSTWPAGYFVAGLYEQELVLAAKTVKIIPQ